MSLDEITVLLVTSTPFLITTPPNLLPKNNTYRF
jgi:hypothetical protein